MHLEAHLPVLSFAELVLANVTRSGRLDCYFGTEGIATFWLWKYGQDYEPPSPNNPVYVQPQ